MKRTTADAIQKTAKQISQARRKASLQKRKDYIHNGRQKVFCQLLSFHQIHG